MWWGGFSELWENGDGLNQVLIPMWWGGFSENMTCVSYRLKVVLIPMWWGGFSEVGGKAPPTFANRS